MDSTGSSTMMKYEVQSLAGQNAMWLNLVNKLLDSNYLFHIEVESNNSLLPIPWEINDNLCMPYGTRDLPFLKKLLYSSDCMEICKSLQALIKISHDCFKVMDMLRLDVLSPLNRLTRHAEPFVRQRCCVLIRVLAGQPLGKVSVVRNAVLVCRLMTLMEDVDYRVRFHCAAALMALAEHRLGNETLVELGCAERTLDRVYAERDGRVVPVLLRTFGRLMATNESVRERFVGAVDFVRLFEGTTGQRSSATGALEDSGRAAGAVGRVLLDYLMRGAESSDYRTALDSVVCMSRAATVREANEYLARDRRTVDLLVSFAWSPELRGRALRTFSIQLLRTLAGSSTGLKRLRAAVAAENLHADPGPCSADDENPVTERQLRKLADFVPRPCDGRNANAVD